MFKSLQERLASVFNSLTGRGSLSEQDVISALREVRRALIEADVSLKVVDSFIQKVREKAMGRKLLRTVKPGQMVIKIVHDELVTILGGKEVNIDLNAPEPVVIMMVGLQGAGKTTTTAKIAARLNKQNKKVLMASLDTYRPAAHEQLHQLGMQAGISTLPIVNGQSPIEIADRSIQTAKFSGMNVVILDTAGRTHVNESLMTEIADIKMKSNPHEVLLVVDSMTGQDAVNLGRSFNERIGITGIILTRMDGDSRGGAALSMKAVTGKPIKAIATGEKIDALEEFHPCRIVNRILGMGDIVSLVEKAAEIIDSKRAESLSKKIQKGKFDLNDLADQLHQIKKLGGVSSIVGLLPSITKLKNQITAIGLNDSIVTKQLAIISSMTPQERSNPDILKYSRKRRIAKGSGTIAADINKLLKMHRQMADAVKAMKGDGSNVMRRLVEGFFLNPSLGGGNLNNGTPDLSSIDITQFKTLKKNG